jgi:hypothetical protein
VAKKGYTSKKNEQEFDMWSVKVGQTLVCLNEIDLLSVV